MVKEINKDEYICEACGYRYKEREVAKRCEKWFTKNRSCNLEITALGMPPKDI